MIMEKYFELGFFGLEQSKEHLQIVQHLKLTMTFYQLCILMLNR